MAVQFFTALLLEVDWRESILNSMLAKKKEKLDLQERRRREFGASTSGGRTDRLEGFEVFGNGWRRVGQGKWVMDPHAAKVREIKAWLAKEEFKTVLDSMLAKKKKKVDLQEFETAEPRLGPHPRVSRISRRSKGPRRLGEGGRQMALTEVLWAFHTQSIPPPVVMTSIAEVMTDRLEGSEVFENG